MEELICTSQRAHLGLHPVREDKEGVVVKQVWNGIQVVGVVVCVSVLNIDRVLLQFYEQKWNAVDESNYVSAASVEFSVDLQFFYGKKVISFLIVWMLEIYDLRTLLFCFSIRTFYSDRYAVTDKSVLLLIDLHKGGRRQMRLHFLLSLISLSGSEPRVEAL